MSAPYTGIQRPCPSFRKASAKKRAPGKKKTTSPFSLRFTEDERAYLNQMRGTQSLAAYIRQCALNNHAEKRAPIRQPKINEPQIAMVLAQLGSSRLSANINQLAKSANMGTLDVSIAIEKELADSCAAILEMRDVLISALGLKPGASK